jgi:hypothetical protein
MRTLYVNGCSWTAGDELESDPLFVKSYTENGLKKSEEDNWTLIYENGEEFGPTSDYRNIFNWGGLLSQKINAGLYINSALGGSSNDKIIRETVDFVLSYPKENIKNLFVVIGWTASDRKEIYVNKTKTFEIFNSTRLFSETLFPNSKLTAQDIKKYDQYHQLYIENVFDYYECIKRKTFQIYSLSNILENLGIKYFFFNSIQNIHESYDINETNKFDSFFNWYDNNKNIFSDITMQEYILDYGCPLAKYRHPLIDGHKIWADFIMEKIKERNIWEII